MREFCYWRSARAWPAGVALIFLAACGQVESATAVSNASSDHDASTGRSSVTGYAAFDHLELTEADAGRVIEVEYYEYDIGLPDKKGMLLRLSGDDASTLRWSMPKKPDPFMMDWYAVDGKLAFETDELVGDPATAAKVLEFRATKEGETRVVLELVERDPAKRSGAPAKQLEYTFQVPMPRFKSSAGGYGVPF